MIIKRFLLTFVFARLTSLQDIGTSAAPSSIITAKSSGAITCLLKCNTSEKRPVTEYRVSLHRGVDKMIEVCSGSFTLSYEPFNKSSESINCLGIPSATNVTFHLWNLKPEHTDIYFCFTNFMAPPPYCEHEDKGTILYVKEDLACEAPAFAAWIMYALVAVLGVYAILVSLTLLYCLQRRGKESEILQSEYANMTPRRCNQQQLQPPVPARAEKLR